MLRYVRDMRYLRIGLVVQRSIDGMKQRCFTVAVAVDKLRLIRAEIGTWLIDCVYCMEAVSRIVNVDGHTRKRWPLFVGVRQRQKC